VSHKFDSVDAFVSDRWSASSWARNTGDRA